MFYLRRLALFCSLSSVREIETSLVATMSIDRAFSAKTWNTCRRKLKKIHSFAHSMRHKTAEAHAHKFRKTEVNKRKTAPKDMERPKFFLKVRAKTPSMSLSNPRFLPLLLLKLDPFFLHLILYKKRNQVAKGYRTIFSIESKIFT